MIINREKFLPVSLPKERYPYSQPITKSVDTIRKDFPILSEKVNGRPLIWFDNAATTQKPNSVIRRLSYYYQHENSNIHRGAHTLAVRATDAYEEARKKIRDFINASSEDEIIFVRGTTEAINMIAGTYGKQNVHKNDEIIISHLEHHANIVPWQLLCKEKGAILRVIPVDDRGQIILSEFQKLINERTKLVSITHVSNVLGTVTPAEEIIEIAHKHGIRVLIDGAQSISHMKIDVQDLDCDFYIFSGHKIYGPTGIGAVYIRAEIMDDMPPYHGGGNMITDVSFEETKYQKPPRKFEAGTGNIADAAGLGASIDYVSEIGMEFIFRYEHFLLEYARETLSSINGLTIVGNPDKKTSLLSFTIKGYTNDKIGSLLSREGIAVRAGHHCAQPILRRFGHETTVRPSFAFYNTKEEIDEMVRVLKQLK